MYFVSLTNIDEFLPTVVTMRINQVLSVERLPNMLPKKFQFHSDRELVKFVVFKVPNTWSFRAENTIEVEMLGDYIFPSIFVKKIETSTEPSDIETMQYPSMVDFDHVFGLNPILQLNSKKMVYRLETQSQLAFTYLTMAVYQNTYGLTDRRKPEFKLTMRSVEVLSPVTSHPHLTVAAQPQLVSADIGGDSQQASLNFEDSATEEAFLQN